MEVIHPPTYTVTFDSQSATVEANPTSKTVTSPSTTVDALPTAPTKTGYTFTGWYTGANGTGTEFTASTIVTADITVYAKWTASLLVMVSVPAGTFQRDGTVANTSTVTAAFRMSEKEITVEQFTAVTGLANPSSLFTAVVNGPVQYTNWYHALVFCNKLSIAEGLTPVYSIIVSGVANTNPADWITANSGIVPITSSAVWDAATANWSASGYRLPTEMEWTWAAMGATSGSGDHTGGIFTNGYLKEFAGDPDHAATGGAIGDYAWYSVNSGSTTHPVGTKTTNELGLYDMTGNVWEWCWDWYDAYPTGALDNDIFRGAASGTGRVVRGGSWNSEAVFVKFAYRDAYYPYSRYGSIGFRVVRP